jgi:hypothetical protein
VTTDRAAPLPVAGGASLRTDFPLFAGAQAFVEHPPTRLRATGAIGVLPSSYARAVNGALRGFGAYDARWAQLLDGSLQDGLSWNLHLGWRPFPRHGLLLEAGYGRANLVARGDATALAQQLSGEAFAIPPGMDTSFRFASSLSFVDARVGWEWRLDPVALQLAVGLSRVIRSSTTLDQPSLPVAPSDVRAQVASETASFDDSLRRYGWIPSLGLAVGATF